MHPPDCYTPVIVSRRIIGSGKDDAVVVPNRGIERPPQQIIRERERSLVALVVCRIFFKKRKVGGWGVWRSEFVKLAQCVCVRERERERVCVRSSTCSAACVRSSGEREREGEMLHERSLFCDES